MHPVHLRSAGTSLLLAFDSGEAEIVHWGADLGENLPDLAILRGPVPHSALDIPVAAGLLPQASSGWAGRPGLRGHRNADGGPGLDFSPALRVVAAQMQDGGRTVVIIHRDSEAGLEVSSELTLHPGGLLELAHTLTNSGTAEYQLDELATVLPVPRDATELLDLTGRWCRENHPHRPARPDRPRLVPAGGSRDRRLRQPHRPGLGHAPGLERQPRAVPRQPRRRPAHARCRRAARLRRSGAAPRRQLPDAVALCRVLRPRPGRHHRGLLPLVPCPAAARGHHLRPGPPRGAEHLGGRLLRPPPRAPARTRRSGRRARRGTLRPRRRLVPRPPRRSRGPWRLVRRRGPVARGPHAADRRSYRPRHGIRALGRTRNGQRRLGPCPRPS